MHREVSLLTHWLESAWGSDHQRKSRDLIPKTWTWDWDMEVSILGYTNLDTTTSISSSTDMLNTNIQQITSQLAPPYRRRSTSIEQILPEECNNQLSIQHASRAKSVRCIDCMLYQESTLVNLLFSPNPHFLLLLNT